jgi:myo-inositol-1(or 4)-monophosphatase
LLEADLTLLVQAAKRSGDIARAHFGNAYKKWDKDGGAGPVTEADLAVNAMLEESLQTARPNYGWLSEETADTQERQNVEHLFIIDPIDGTRSFIEGSKTWAHSLAIAQHGEIIAGVVYLPMRSMMFTATRGGGAFLNGDRLSLDTAAPVTDDLSGAHILATKPNMQPQHWRGGKVPQFTRHHRPSLAYRLALIAEGRFDAMMTLRPSWEWDIAAGALIASEAGARVTTKNGKALKFNAPHPQLDGVLVAPEPMHQALFSLLEPTQDLTQDLTKTGSPVPST